MHNKLEEIHLLLSQTTISYKKYKLLFLSQVYIVEHDSGVFASFNRTNFIKKYSFENLAKYLVFKIRGQKRQQFKNSCDFLFVNEVNNKPVIETLKAVEKEFSVNEYDEIISDKRLYEKGGNQINVFQFATFKVLLTTIFDSVKLLTLLYRNRKQFIEVAETYKVGKMPLLLNCFDSVFMINVLENCLKEIKPKKIVLISDVHKMSRIATLYARNNNIHSFVLQHGATVGGYGYLPVLSDKMLVWGDLSRKWFINRGQEQEKLVVVGSPRMDRVISSELKKIGTADQNKGISALIVMSEMRYEKEFLEIIRDALIKLKWPNLRINVKLHPAGDANYRPMVEDVFVNSGLNYSIYGAYDLKKLLLESSFVFVTTSSVGMEAIIFNKPILQFKIEKFSYIKMSYEDYNCSHVFRNSEEIVAVLSDPEKVQSQLSNYKSFVTDYFYKLDGLSSNRAQQIIRSYK